MVHVFPIRLEKGLNIFIIILYLMAVILLVEENGVPGENH